jgi:hypothetical protein
MSPSNDPGSGGKEMTAIEQAVAFLKSWCAEQREIEKGTTEGPWYAKGEYSPVVTRPGGNVVSRAENFGDDTFIASARTSLPAAVKAIEALIGQIENDSFSPENELEQFFVDGQESMILVLASGLGWEAKP